LLRALAKTINDEIKDETNESGLLRSSQRRRR